MRFNNEFNDDEDFDELDYLLSEEPDYGSFEDFGIQHLQLSLQEADINRRILAGAVKMLEKSFIWRFLPYKTRLKRIQEVYLAFTNMVSGSEEQ